MMILASIPRSVAVTSLYILVPTTIACFLPKTPVTSLNGLRSNGSKKSLGIRVAKAKIIGDGYYSDRESIRSAIAASPIYIFIGDNEIALLRPYIIENAMN